jgi:hypothetical protein
LHFILSSFFSFVYSVSPSKDYGVRASNQLNSLRTLLERRLMEDDDDINHQTKDFSILQTSPGTFTKDFLQSYQGVKYNRNSNDIVSDLDDDEYIQQIKTNYNHSDVLSTSNSSSTQQHESVISDDVKQDNIHSNRTLSTSSTVTSNYRNKIDTRKTRYLRFEFFI